MPVWFALVLMGYGIIAVILAMSFSASPERSASEVLSIAFIWPFWLVILIARGTKKLWKDR